MLHKLSSGLGHHSKKCIFDHVTSLIGENIFTAYSEKFNRATAYTCQILKESALWLRKENAISGGSGGVASPIYKQAYLAGCLMS